MVERDLDRQPHIDVNCRFHFKSRQTVDSLLHRRCNRHSENQGLHSAISPDRAPEVAGYVPRWILANGHEYLPPLILYRSRTLLSRIEGIHWHHNRNYILNVLCFRVLYRNKWFTNLGSAMSIQVVTYRSFQCFHQRILHLP
jgi:hypothetical protein